VSQTPVQFGERRSNARLHPVIARVAVFIAVSVLLAGCGGSESSGAQARSVVERYYAALESGNGAALCALLSGSAREEIVRRLVLFPALKHTIDCARLMTVPRRAAALRKTTGIKVGAATLMGDRATVVVTKPGEGPREVTLVKTPNGWRINKPTFRVRKPIGG
jgi:hypothetical protein